MQIGSINSNYNNYTNYTRQQRVNFKGEVTFTQEQFINETKKIAQFLVKDRKDAISAKEKKSIFDQASRMVLEKIRTIRDNYSPLVEVELGQPAIFYNNLVDVISSSRNCYGGMRNAEGWYHNTRYVTLKENKSIVNFVDLDLNDHNVRNEIETGFINHLILYFEMYNNRKQYIPMSQIQLTDYEPWGDTEVAINDDSRYYRTISNLRAIDINDEYILKKVELLEKINNWFKEHPELKTKEIEDKLTQANTLRQDIEAKLTHNTNMNFEDFTVASEILNEFGNGKTNHTMKVPAEDLLPIDSVVCTLDDINNYIMEHVTEIDSGRIFNKPVTKDGESLLIALAHVQLDEDNTDAYIKLVKNMLKMPFIDYNQKDTMNVPFIAHVLNSQNKVLFAAVTGCKNLKYDPSLESEFNAITGPEFKELVLKTPIFENEGNSKFKTIFGKPNPMYKKSLR